MSIPFQLIWSDVSNNILTKTWFPIGFPGTSSTPIQLQVRSNAADIGTFETLTGVKFYLTGNAVDVSTVQTIWPSIGGTDRPELNGGLDISFDFGRSYTRFDVNNGLQSNPNTWISLPAEAVGLQGADGTLGAFDTAHLLIRIVVPPGAIQFKKLDIRLALDFDII
jgi:hypothetical protein